MKQLNLIPIENYEHGGNLHRGRRKAKRPLNPKLPLHLVLKSSNAKGRFVFSPGNKRLSDLIQNFAGKFEIRIYDKAINFSHIHLCIKIKDRNSYLRFIRAVTAAITKLLKAPKGFFDLLPYTKAVTWGRQLKVLYSYIAKNRGQAKSRCEMPWQLRRPIEIKHDCKFEYGPDSSG